MEPKKFDKEELKRAADILMEAEEIKDDVMLMTAVQKYLKKNERAIKSIQDIKDRYVEVTMTVPEEDVLEEDAGTVRVKRKSTEGEEEDK
jgi:hypothetical protein